MKAHYDAGDRAAASSWCERLSATLQNHKILAAFPPSVLYLLRSALLRVGTGARPILTHDLQTAATAIDDSLRRLTGGSDGEPQSAWPPLVAAQVLAHNILSGTAPATAILRLGRACSPSGSWRRTHWSRMLHDGPALQCCEDLLPVLRSLTSTTYDRLEAIGKLSGVMANVPYRNQITNALYHAVLCWPLLVVLVERPDRPRLISGALSLPVIIDVRFGPAPSDKTTNDSAPSTRDRCIVLPTDDALNAFQLHLRKAMDAAKDLWMSKHRNYGPFCKAVERADVVFDFTIARYVDPEASIEGGSAEAYFAQAVLHRLLGRLGTLSSVASGHIDRVAVLDNLPKELTPKGLKRTMQLAVRGYANKKETGPLEVIPGTRSNAGEKRLLWTDVWTGRKALQWRHVLWQQSTVPDYRDQVGSLFRRYGHLYLRKAGGSKDKLELVHASHFFERIVLHQATERELLKDQLCERGIKDNAARKIVRQFHPERVRLQLAVYDWLTQNRDARVARNGAAWLAKAIRENFQPPTGFQSAPGALSTYQSPTAEVISVPTPQHMADVMQVAGWRRHHYIRCPDLMWAFHEQYNEALPGLLPAEPGSAVDRVLAQLQDNTAPVLELRAAPQTVLSALWHINYELRDRSVKAFSWACLRLARDEMDARFWQTFWRVLGAPLEVVQQFLLTPTPAAAATLLVEALSHFSPAPAAPGYRAPEVILLIGTDRFAESLAKHTGPLSSRPLALPFVLKELRSHGVPYYTPLERHLGRTRIICVPEDQQLTLNAAPPACEISQADRLFLRAVRTFRWGFTQQMASMMLQVLADDQQLRAAWPRHYALRENLSRLREERLLRYGQGVYHLPPDVRDALGPPHAPRDDARLHLAAGVAIAPYTARRPVPSLAFDLAFLPENVHEASHHFRTAFSLAQGVDERLADHARNNLQHVCRFVELRDWGLQSELTKGKDALLDAWELGNELLATHDQHGTPCHPARVLQVARAGMSYLKQLRGPDQDNDAHDVRCRIDGLFRQAQAACDRPEWSSDRNSNLLAVLSTWATYSMQNSPQLVSQIRQLNDDIWNLLKSNTPASLVWGEWFELVADRETNHADAAAIYALAIENVPAWHQNWIKGVGAEVLGGLINPPICKKLTAKPPDQIAHILKKAALGLKDLQTGHASDVVHDRWRSGAAFFFSHWSANTNVQPFLAPYRFLQRSQPRPRSP
ncbi:MAG: hypothetical protein HYS13_17690 [Planctomycetia bacterium]|nr:hypothetical protein [Planctomycetia bacterium]